MLSKFIMTFMAFFAIMNPISNLPAFMALVAGDSKDISKKVAQKGIVIAFGIVVIFTLFGNDLFHIFGITIHALKIAGGILVALIGYHMINGVHGPANQNINSGKNDPMNVAISPLAMPLLAGPGTIATAISLSDGGFENKLMTIVSFALLCVITYFLLVSANKIMALLGKNSMGIITRMMGLILTTIGIQMLIAGIQGAFLIK